MKTVLYKIVIDTREPKLGDIRGHQWTFECVEPEYAAPELVRKKLDQGDFCIEGYEDGIVIERKTPADLCSSLVTGKDRFKAERMRLVESCEKPFVVVEGSLNDIYNEFIHNHPLIVWTQMRGLVLGLIEEYKTPVIPCGGLTLTGGNQKFKLSPDQHAQYTAFHLMRIWHDRKQKSRKGEPSLISPQAEHSSIHVDK